MERNALGSCALTDRDRSQKVGLALQRRGACSGREVQTRGCASQVVGERHDRPAVEKAVAVRVLLPNHQLGDDPVALVADELDSQEPGERRLRCGNHRPIPAAY